MAVTVDDVRDYLGAARLSDVDENALVDALGAAEQLIAERCWWDTDEGDPYVIDQATVMQAARLYRRKFSITGYEGFGDVGIARIPVLDPDIEQLVMRYLRYDFA